MLLLSCACVVLQASELWWTHEQSRSECGTKPDLMMHPHPTTPLRSLLQQQQQQQSKPAPLTRTTTTTNTHNPTTQHRRVQELTAWWGFSSLIQSWRALPQHRCIDRRIRGPSCPYPRHAMPPFVGLCVAVCRASTHPHSLRVRSIRSQSMIQCRAAPAAAAACVPLGSREPHPSSPSRHLTHPILM